MTELLAQFSDSVLPIVSRLLIDRQEQGLSLSIFAHVKDQNLLVAAIENALKSYKESIKYARQTYAESECSNESVKEMIQLSNKIWELTNFQLNGETQLPIQYSDSAVSYVASLLIDCQVQGFAISTFRRVNTDLLRQAIKHGMSYVDVGMDGQSDARLAFVLKNEDIYTLNVVSKGALASLEKFSKSLSPVLVQLHLLLHQSIQNLKQSKLEINVDDIERFFKGRHLLTCAKVRQIKNFIEANSCSKALKCLLDALKTQKKITATQAKKLEKLFHDYWILILDSKQKGLQGDVASSFSIDGSSSFLIMSTKRGDRNTGGGL